MLYRCGNVPVTFQLTKISVKELQVFFDNSGSANFPLTLTHLKNELCTRLFHRSLIY